MAWIRQQRLFFFFESIFRQKLSASSPTADQRQGCDHFYVQCKRTEISIWVLESVHIVQMMNAHKETDSHLHLEEEQAHFLSLERAHRGRKKHNWCNSLLAPQTGAGNLHGAGASVKSGCKLGRPPVWLQSAGCGWCRQNAYQKSSGGFLGRKRLHDNAWKTECVFRRGKIQSEPTYWHTHLQIICTRRCDNCSRKLSHRCTHFF